MPGDVRNHVFEASSKQELTMTWVPGGRMMLQLKEPHQVQRTVVFTHAGEDYIVMLEFAAHRQNARTVFLL